MKRYLIILVVFLSLKIEAQTPNSYPPTGETVIGGHLHVGASNEVWTDAPSLYFNWRGNAVSTYFWNLGGTTGSSVLSILNTGNVGIGINAPTAKLEINGNLKLIDSQIPTWNLGFGTNGDPVRFLAVDVVNSAVQEDPLELVYNRGVGVKIGKDDSENKYLKVYGPLEAKKLDVNGTIHAREVKVDLTGWSDFVFHSSFKLKSLAEVEQFIQLNGHLEDIPSAEEVLRNGVNLGDIQAKLLQKIEELTLYAIEKDKQIRKQEQKTEEMENALLEQKNMIIELRKELELLKQQ